MEKNYHNKAITNSKTKGEEKTGEVEQEFFFPDKQITIKAANLAEAEKKLEEMAANK
jgi:hypothetical protein